MPDDDERLEGEHVSRWRILSLILLLVCLGGETVLVDSQPTQPSTKELLAEALQLVQRGQLPDALKPLRQLNTRRLSDELPPMWQQRLTFLLGLAYFQSGDFGKATLHFERVRDGYPGAARLYPVVFGRGSPPTRPLALRPHGVSMAR